MELLNATKMQASYTQGMDKTGREYLVVVVKGTFTLPLDGSEPQLAAQQLPAVEADAFTGEPGFSAPLYESDYAPIKKRCDILLNGSAYAPNGRPAKSVDVGIKVADITKVFTVVGDRYWYVASGGLGATKPQPFDAKPISYDVAFGGVDNFHQDPAKHDAYYANPIGRGFHNNLSGDLVHNTPLPNTEERGVSVSNPAGKYRPMSFGPIARGWQPRSQYAGTYDQDWIDNTFPFLPADFDETYYQAAPEDQQTQYLQGGEQVNLVNLTPQGRTRFVLPRIDIPVVFFRKRDDDEHKKAVLDTLVIEPDKGLFTLTWRSSTPLKKNMFEIPQVLVGKKSRAWWRARELGKEYHSSLDQMIRSQQEVEDEA